MAGPLKGRSTILISTKVDSNAAMTVLHSAGFDCIHIIFLSEPSFVAYYKHNSTLFEQVVVHTRKPLGHFLFVSSPLLLYNFYISASLVFLKDTGHSQLPHQS